MLYKKIHRQFLRDFRIGRTFKFKSKSDSGIRVVNKLFIRKECICIDYDLGYTWALISLSGRIMDDIEWLD